jgi:hypothetical protein
MTTVPWGATQGLTHGKIWRLGSGANTVPVPHSWNAVSAIDGIDVRPWLGIVWRSHGVDLTSSRRTGTRIFYDPTSNGGSRRKSGRYHRASDYFPASRVWPALYTSLTDGGCIAEAVRHAGSLASLDVLRITRLQVELSAVLDLTDPGTYGLTLDDVSTTATTR